MSTEVPPTGGVSARRRLLLAAACLGAALALPGPMAVTGERPGAVRQATPPLPRAARPTAYLVTVGPGEAIWERFGHNLLWIHEPGGGADQGYNYGLFSFDQESFLLRFARGHMRYWMEGFDLRAQLELYAGENRSIWIQELGLEPGRVRELHEFLRWNELPENRFYRYDYYRDNCSTRVRDALDRVLDGRLAAWARQNPTPASYRDHTLRQTAGLFWASVGMHFGLGPAADPPLSAWEAMFIPMELQKHVRGFTVLGQDGEESPLVRSEWIQFEATRPPTPDMTPRWLLPFLLAGLGLTALIGALSALARRPGRAGATLVGLIAAWSAVLGLAGSIVAGAWAFTDHVFTHGNLNLFLASPLHLLLALALTITAVARCRRRGHRWASRIAAAIAILTVVGMGVEALPGRGQVNGEFVTLLVPTNLAMAWALRRRRNAGGADDGGSRQDIRLGPATPDGRRGPPW